MKTCSKCSVPQRAAAFRKDPRYAGGRFCWCHDCVHAYGSNPLKLAKERRRRKQQFKDPAVRDARRQRCRERYTNPRVKRQVKDSYYRRVYGITLEFFENEVQKQQRKCKVCGQVRELVADHSHITKKYRGAICRLCNVAIGRIESVLNFIPKAQEYINVLG